MNWLVAETHFIRPCMVHVSCCRVWSMHLWRVCLIQAVYMKLWLQYCNRVGVSGVRGERQLAQFSFSLQGFFIQGCRACPFIWRKRSRSRRDIKREKAKERHSQTDRRKQTLNSTEHWRPLPMWQESTCFPRFSIQLGKMKDAINLNNYQEVTWASGLVTNLREERVFLAERTPAHFACHLLSRLFATVAFS